jgi:hypothetical protein
MKKLILLSFFVCYTSFFAFGQQQQSDLDPFYYEIEGLIYLNKFDGEKRQPDPDVFKIPKPGLAFTVVRIDTMPGVPGTPAIPANGDKAGTLEIKARPAYVFYVLEFYDIEVEEEKNRLVGSNVYINSNDNEDYFCIKKTDFDTYVKTGLIAKYYDTRPGLGKSTQLAFGIWCEFVITI